MEACKARDARALEVTRDEMAVLHAQATTLAVEAIPHAGGVRDHYLGHELADRPAHQGLQVIAHPLALLALDAVLNLALHLFR